jgi:Bacterial aa3 type cytochrome c oxidase subunit IV.
MAEHPTGPAEVGAPMDYAEHEKTYNLFLAGAKYGTLVTVALLIFMAVLFFTKAGFIASAIVFLIVCAVGGYLLR